VTGILNGQRWISGDTALRLAHFFGTSPEFWLNLQSLYELRLAQQKIWQGDWSPADSINSGPRSCLIAGTNEAGT
jgi:plasmid maintenance system antidote protein VapI